MVQPILAKAIRKSLPTLAKTCMDFLDDAARLVREVQNLGDALLVMDSPPKLPFWKILEVEAILLKDYGDLIDSEVEAGGGSQELLAKVLDKAKLGHAHASKDVAAASDDLMRGPKPGQLAPSMEGRGERGLEARVRWFGRNPASGLPWADTWQQARDEYGAPMLNDKCMEETHALEASKYGVASGDAASGKRQREPQAVQQSLRFDVSTPLQRFV